MSTRRPTSTSERTLKRAISLAALAAAIVCAPSTARSDDEARLRAAYPMTMTSTVRAAGLDLANLSLPNLRLSNRDDRAPEHGGTTLSFADGQGQVQLVIRLAVTADATAARAFAYARLRGITTTLAPSMVDEIAFANDTGSLVVAAHGNVSYQIDSQGSLAATEVAKKLAPLFVAGAPAFPKATILLPPSIARTGSVFNVSVPAGVSVRYLAKNGYVTRLRGSTSLHPSSPGRVEVTAIVADDLGRVTEVSASTIAQ